MRLENEARKSHSLNGEVDGQTQKVRIEALLSRSVDKLFQQSNSTVIAVSFGFVFGAE